MAYQDEPTTNTTGQMVKAVEKTIGEPASFAYGDNRLVEDISAGLDLGWKRNLFQAITALVFILIGAIIGYSSTKDVPEIAALLGAAVGMVLGTFFSGFILMFCRMPRVPLHFAQDKYVRLKKRTTRFVVVWIVFILLSLLAIIFLANRNTGGAFLVCLLLICLIGGGQAYLIGLGDEMKKLDRSIKAAENDRDTA